MDTKKEADVTEKTVQSLHGRGDKHKYDNDKLMWDLLPLNETEKIVEILTFGAEKYGPDQWQKVPNAKRRYFAALMRHLKAYWVGEKIDSESGRSHLAHAGCCLLFLLWFEGNAKTDT